eukprot:scaffold2652_cov120-Skeletonema_dohrnii-CCMP3373.AAC.7
MDANVLGRALAYCNVGLPSLKLSGGVGTLVNDRGTLKLCLVAAFLAMEDVLESNARDVWRRLYVKKIDTMR